MCLISFAVDQHERYPLVVALNRDEFYERPTLAAKFWSDAPDVLAGQDLKAGGTWFGITRRGEWAAVTNYREPKAFQASTPSRGVLVRDFLISLSTPDEYLQTIEPIAHTFAGFSLILGDRSNVAYFSNRSPDPQTLGVGIYGLSNGCP